MFILVAILICILVSAILFVRTDRQRYVLGTPIVVLTLVAGIVSATLSERTFFNHFFSDFVSNVFFLLFWIFLYFFGVQNERRRQAEEKVDNLDLRVLSAALLGAQGLLHVLIPALFGDLEWLLASSEASALTFFNLYMSFIGAGLLCRLKYLKKVRLELQASLEER